MLHAEVTDRELIFAHKMSLQTLQSLLPQIVADLVYNML